MNILITGSTGFVGTYLSPYLADHGLSVTPLVSSSSRYPSTQQHRTSLSEILLNSSALNTIDCVVHLAGRSHVMNETSTDPHLEYQLSNFYETALLAQYAVAHRVKKFIYLSTAKVYGEFSPSGLAFSPISPTNPVDSYAHSKLRAEDFLLSLSSASSTQFSIIRPPLIYGPNVKGNLKQLVTLLQSSVPLPLASITGNRRSLLSIYNLSSFILHILTSNNDLSGIHVITDHHDVSTLGLVRSISQAIDARPLLFPFPEPLFDTLPRIKPINSIRDRLYRCFALDPKPTFDRLSWTPPVTFEEGISLSFKYV